MTDSFYGTRYREGPAVIIDAAQEAYCETLYARMMAESARPPGDDTPPPLLDLTAYPSSASGPGYAKYACLWYLVERKGLLIRGINAASFSTFTPQDGLDYFGRPVKAVFASADAAWPMFFALVDRLNPRFKVFWGGGLWAVPDAGEPRKVYACAINCEAFENDPYTAGSLYLLPPAGFQPVTAPNGLRTLESLSTEPVRPLARVDITIADFPLRDDVRSFEFDDLSNMLDLKMAARVSQLADGLRLAIDPERMPYERVERALRFLVEFNPGYQATLAHGEEIIAVVRFPPGAVNFCKAEWLGE